MMPLGGTPVIVHVIKSFVRQGYCDFVLAAGYRKAALDDYFEGKDIGAKVEILDTGDETDTAGRILACRDHLGDTFIATYADGLCDVPLDQLVAHHHAHDGLVTITSVPMWSNYGVLSLDAAGHVERLEEKPLIADRWINAGFIVFDKAVFDHWEGENLEREVLPRLIEQGKVCAYRHTGFFKSVDHYKDILEFEELLENDRRPWDLKAPQA
jgi:glucose-1-phosphate cytidylyltransferase